MKTQYILFLLVLTHFSAFAQKVDTMMYQPVYSATETFSMRVGRMLERRVTEFKYGKESMFSIKVIKLKDERSGEQQRGIELSQEGSEFRGIIDMDELDEFITNIEKLHTRMNEERPPHHLTLWSVSKGGIKYQLTTEFPKPKADFAKNPWTFIFSCYPFKWEQMIFITPYKLKNIIDLLKIARERIKE